MEQVNCDYKKMYLATVKREQELKKGWEEATEKIAQQLSDALQENKKVKEFNRELKDQVKYLEDEVCRYSNAI